VYHFFDCTQVQSENKHTTFFQSFDKQYILEGIGAS
jgi:hypothetical protein